MNDRFCLEVTGDFACFTRPEMKAERVSYDVITPSAARAIFESILWKPEIFWEIQQIEVLKPIKWINLRRNEVGSKIPVNSVSSLMKTGTGTFGLYVEEDRQQRAGLFLRDVAYRLYAILNVKKAETLVKYQEMFRRRASKGQCFHQPYLGCREFACSFRLIENHSESSPPQEISQELGWMLFDMDFSSLKDPKPKFFKAKLEQGVLKVPEPTSAEVRG